MEDVNTHPAVVLALVIAAVIAIVIATAKKAAGEVAPWWALWQGRQERRYQRQVRIEAAARLLNDERVGILLERVDGLGAEIIAQRQELTAQRDEERARADRYENELGIVRRQLDQALTEIRTLRRDQEVSRD